LQAAVALSDKSVRRQRRLGELAMRSGKPEVAERALRAAIRVGQLSCFSSSSEYLQLSELLVGQSQGARALAVLRDGRKLMESRPAEAMQLATAQAISYRRQGAEADAKRFLHEALALSATHSSELPPNALLALADACLQMGEQERGLDLIKTAMTNAYDEVETAARKLLADHGLQQEARALIDHGCEEILRLNDRGVKLFEESRCEEAAELLMQAADRMPRNRLINLNAAKILLNLMLQRGRDRSSLTSVRRYLDRLKANGETSEEFRRMQQVFGKLQAS
jgi:hypothetical protein